MRFISRVMGVALIFSLLPGSPALAARSVTITGGGWGHGMGMSQYGAYGRARRGDAAPKILEHYYSGSDVREAGVPGTLRVGLLEYRSSISAGSSAFREGGGDVVFKVKGSKTRIARGSSGARWRIEPSSTGGMRLYKNGNQIRIDGRSVFGDPAHPLIAQYQRFDSLLRIEEKGISYAYGHMEFGTFPTDRCSAGHCLRLVISLPMQKYLYGLGEVPFSWPGAALRTQVIAARTYAYEKILRMGQHRYPCDCAVYDSTLDQVYSGDAKRVPSGQYWDDWTSAVDDTKRQVVLHNGVPIQALYSSSSGGHTENNENVWGGTPLPYLRGVRDAPDDNSANPNHTWTLDMSYSTFQSKLDASYGVGSVDRFNLVRPFGVSGRVTVVKPDNTGGVKIVGSRKTVRTSGWSIRSALGLKDSLFRVQINYEVGQKMAPKYRRLDGAPGDPTGASYPVPIGREHSLGRAQDFEKGRLTWRRATDQTVWQRGAILTRYDQLGREKSSLGMPTSDVWGPGRYLGASYVNGVILWSRATDAHSVKNRFREAFASAAGAQGPLGLPTSEQRKASTLPNGGKRQRFVSGSLYLNPNDRNVYALWGQFDTRYRNMREARSRCGYPISSVTGTDGVKQVSFQNGTMSWTAVAGLEVNCS